MIQEQMLSAAQLLYSGYDMDVPCVFMRVLDSCKKKETEAARNKKKQREEIYEKKKNSSRQDGSHLYHSFLGDDADRAVSDLGIWKMEDVRNPGYRGCAQTGTF